jgi:ribulose-5-phosphate 4-epimerase/fuculose-1-phosphate aldolase
MPRRTEKKTSGTAKKIVNEIVHLKDLVAQANRILFHEKLADYHGHVSARVPGTRTLLIKPILVPLNKIRGKDILALNMDDYVAFRQSRQAPSGQERKAPSKREMEPAPGETILHLAIDDYIAFLQSKQAPSGQERKAPSKREIELAPGETILHLAIYEARPDVFSVVHTHQSLATAFSIANVPILPVFASAARNAPCTPILQNPQTIRTLEMAQEAAQALGQASALLLRNHGVVVVGRTVQEATSGAVYLERNAHMQLVATLLGNAAPIPEQFITELATNMNRLAPVSFAYFASLFSK